MTAVRAARRSSSRPATARRPASATTRRATRVGGAPRRPSASRSSAALVPDDRAAIEARAASTAPARHPLVVTTGGTGLTPRDVTPAGDPRPSSTTRSPGSPRRCAPPGAPRRRSPTCRAASSASRGRTLVVNLPGSPKGALESLEAIEAVLDHALETLAGPYDHAITRRPGRPGPLMFDTFAEVPAYPLVFPIFWGAAAFFVLAMARHLRVFAVARPSRPVRQRPARASSASSSTPSSRRRCSRTRGAGADARRASSGASCCSRSARRTSSPAGSSRRCSRSRSTGCCGRAISAMQNVVAVIVLVSIGWAFFRRLVDEADAPHASTATRSSSSG